MNNSTAVSSIQETARNKMHLAELVGWSIFNGFVAIMAIFGNSLVIVAFTRFKKLRTRTNYFVVGLAAADTLVGLLSVPLWMATLISIWLESVSWMNNSLLYRAFIALDVFSGIASIFHLLLISLERLYAIACPVRHRVSSKSSYLIAVATTWSVAFVATTVIVPEKNIAHFPRFLVLLFSFLVPLKSICITYITMFFLVKFQKHDSNAWNSQKEVTLILTIFLVIVLFIAAWTPFMIINIIVFFCEKCSMPNKVVYFSKLLHCSNSAVNPVVYGYRMSEFKKAFYILVKRRKHWRDLTLSNRASFDMKHLSQRRQGRRSVEAEDNDINPCAEFCR